MLHDGAVTIYYKVCCGRYNREGATEEDIMEADRR